MSQVHIKYLLAAALVAVVATLGAGCTAAPAAEQTYPILNKVIVTADLVRGSKNPAGAVCALTGQFARGEEIVPRVKIEDPKTEKFLTDKEIKSAKFMMKDGTSVALQYGGHPGGANAQPTDYFWAGAWQVPDNYPTGASGWWVEATTNDGRTGRYDPPKVAISALTIVDRVASKQ